MSRKKRNEFRSDLEYNSYVDLSKRVRNKNIKLEYETEKLLYVVEKFYIPDLILVYPCGHRRYIEMKGYFRPEDRRKMIAVKKANPKLDIRIVFPKDNKCGKRMRYSDWCRKYGYKFHIGTEVPKQWLTRKG